MIRGTGIDSTVKLYLKGNGANLSTKIYDDSQSHNSVTAHGNAQISTTESYFEGSSIYFDGNASYLQTSPNSDFSFASNTNMSVSCWVKFTSFSNPIMAYAGNDATWNASTGIEWSIYPAASPGTPLRIAWWTGSAPSFIESNIACVSDTWYYITVLKSGTSIYMYIDGTLVASTTGISMSAITTPIGFLLGKQTGSADGYFNGYVDDLIIQNEHTNVSTKVPTRQRG